MRNRLNTGSIQRRRWRGMSMIELMVALAISSTLLVAVGMAWTASADAVESNDKFFRATQSVRIVMTQLMSEVRRCQSINDSMWNVSDFDITSGDHLRLTTGTLERPFGTPARGSLDLEWKYVPANTQFTNPFTGELVPASPTGQIKLLNHTAGQEAVNTVADNVTSCEFRWKFELDAGGLPSPAIVSVSITTSVGGNSVTVTGSAAPRTNIIY